MRVAGLRVTASGLAVLRVLASSERAISCSEVLTALAPAPWGAATVYRILVRLTKGGLIWKECFPDGSTRYGMGGSARHGLGSTPQFWCRSCGASEPVLAVSRNTRLPDHWRAALAHARLRFVGLCPTCDERGELRSPPV